MGVNKTPDGRVNVGLGYSDLNQYKGYAGRREIVIQLTATGATQDSLDALDFLKSYAVYHNSVGEPIFPASTNVFISNNGVTKAVEADEVTVDGANVNIGGCVWNGTAWDFTNAGQGGGGSSGGGVLVVNITNGTSNKTWQAIWDAYASGAGCKFVENFNEYTTAEWYLATVKEAGSSYKVELFTVDINESPVSILPATLSCDSASGYPTGSLG